MTKSWMSSHEENARIEATKSHRNLSMFPNLGNCSIIIHETGSSIRNQILLVSNFSVLIDSGQAAFNLTAFVGCLGRKENNLTMTVGFYTDNFIFISISESKL